MPFLGGQATFSGLMFGTTSYSHANSLFHLLATVSCRPARAASAGGG